MLKDSKQTRDAIVLGKKRGQPLAWKAGELLFVCFLPSYRKIGVWELSFSVADKCKKSGQLVGKGLPVITNYIMRSSAAAG